MPTPERIIIHVAYDVTDVLPDDLPRTEEDIKEFFADTPDVISDAQWIGVVKVDQK